MWSRMNDVLKSTLFKDLHVVRRTKDAEILGLIRKLRPQNCGLELIRIGASGDGGYLIPNDLEGIEYCFSPGVGPLSDFENDLADRGIRTFLADYSVEGPAITRPEFTFDKKFLGSSDRDEFFTLTAWKEKYLKGYSGDLLLQMDIEGAEYEVILNAPDELLNQFRIAVIEFHALDRLFDPFVFKIYSECFEKLLRYFHIAHIHPNNLCRRVKKGKIEILTFMEFTFLNKRRVHSTRPQQEFPHKLDMDNSIGRPIVLPKCWHSFD